jgi:hypothetical protein
MTIDWSDSENYYHPQLTPLNNKCNWAELGEERINFVELLAVNRDTLDKWIDLSADIRRNWDNTKPILACVDITQTNLTFSPYFVKRGSELMQINPEATSYIAWVVRRDWLGRVFESFLRSQKNATFRIFFERKDAIDWLRKNAKSIKPLGNEQANFPVK